MIRARKPHARTAAGCDGHGRLEAEELGCTFYRFAVSARARYRQLRERRICAASSLAKRAARTAHAPTNKPSGIEITSMRKRRGDTKRPASGTTAGSRTVSAYSRRDLAS